MKTSYIKQLSAVFCCVIFCFELNAANETLPELFQKIRSAQNDEEMLESNRNFAEAFKQRITQTDGFTYSFDELSEVGKVMSDDGKLRIFSWNYRLSDGSYGYNSYMLYKPKKQKDALLSELATEAAFKPADNKTYTGKNWYGSLYYKAIKQKDGYILLGFSQYSDLSKVKVIEPLQFRNDKAVFGDKIFKPYTNNKTTARVVFEYNSIADMNLSYDSEHKRFIFDHLSPEEASLKGIYQYYGPDFSVDQLTLKKKLWTLTESIDIRNNF